MRQSLALVLDIFVRMEIGTSSGSYACKEIIRSLCYIKWKISDSGPPESGIPKKVFQER